MDKNATGQDQLLYEAEQVALSAWKSHKTIPTDHRRMLARAFEREVAPLRTRRIADRLYRLNGRTGFFAWLDYLPFGSAFLKWSLPNDVELTADGTGYQIPSASPTGAALRLPDDAATLARRALTTPEVSEVAVFTETNDPVLAVRMADGGWYELVRWA